MKCEESPACMTCSYFYITWDKGAPRGCRYFGFKCTALPSAVVLRESGQPCNFYRPKTAAQASEKSR